MKQKTLVPLVKIVLALVLTCSIVTSAVGRQPGVWIASSGGNGPCEAYGQICAEWFGEDGWRATCCIPESYLDSGDPSACYLLVSGFDPRDGVP